MQTFLPYPDLGKSAQCLDRQRLGKQRVEAYQILLTLMGKSQGWINHPATKMWRGHEDYLTDYIFAMCYEWSEVRGYKDTIGDKTRELIKDPFFKNYTWNSKPTWIGDEKLHASHRSNLLRKDPVYYSQFNWQEDSTLTYVWPV